MNQRPISTHDLDLAAAVMTATGEQPTMYRQPGQALVSFDLPDTLTTHRVLSEYATGSLVARACQ